ncbi:MAG: glucosaminidase domain-containing protein [Marinilabiliales bacterium]|nr:glucosaminidase domain-containing protein [Marinilabiliales bacterium]
MRLIKRIFLGLFGVLVSAGICRAYAPQKMTRQQYIDKFARLAVQEMTEFRIPASITMAQACLESSDGNSELTRSSNNHFGIKCKSNWSGPTVRHDDDEANECFRKYRDAEESFRDHSLFLSTTPRYSFLFSYNPKDFKGWAYGLKQAGYATDPGYPAKLIRIIEEFRLYELDGMSGGYARTGDKPKHHFSLFGFLKRKAPVQVAAAPGGVVRVVEKRNGAWAFTAVEGDDYTAIANEYGKKDWQIYRYNDAYQGDAPLAGEPVYLQAKRSKAPRGNDFHLVQEGETIHSIAQWYGVKMQSLRKMNGMSETEEVHAGQQLSLRKKIR